MALSRFGPALHNCVSLAAQVLVGSQRLRYSALCLDAYATRLSDFGADDGVWFLVATGRAGRVTGGG